VPEAFYRAYGYHVCGPRAVRLDMLERLADLIRPLLAWRGGNGSAPPKGATGDGGFTVIPEMMSLLGCSPDELGGVLKALGFRLDRRPIKPAAIAVVVEAAAAPNGEAAIEPVVGDIASSEATVSPAPQEPAPAAAESIVADASAPVVAEQKFEDIWRPRRHARGDRRKEHGQRGRHRSGQQAAAAAAWWHRSRFTVCRAGRPARRACQARQGDQYLTARGGGEAKGPSDSQRIDKWLWFARFIKTRTLAADIVSAGKVRINRARVEKPSQTVRAGDVLTLVINRRVQLVRVLGIGERRGPSAAARALYEELTAEGDVIKPSAPSSPRGAALEPTEASPIRRPAGSGRPTKKERREIDRLKEKAR
jgi:ribosomal 50S subunit-recycling heat shock protein